MLVEGCQGVVGHLSAHCRSGLVSRKGCAAAPGSVPSCKIAGAALRPFRDTRPLLQGAVIAADTTSPNPCPLWLSAYLWALPPRHRFLPIVLISSLTLQKTIKNRAPDRSTLCPTQAAP
ncbi:hypothetical protein E3U47_02350 [Pseudomonas sp. RIT623]|nr:hypothetical protein E3U47_02350 [Pseudomonas sp. RIT623]